MPKVEISLNMNFYIPLMEKTDTTFFLRDRKSIIKLMNELNTFFISRD